MTRNIAVVLSGCGFLDGSEITEAISTLIAIGQTGAKYQCYAPDISVSAVNHREESLESETRNALVEAARIARGQILPLAKLNTAEFDALVFPGGFGAAKVLCNWASRGANSEVLGDVDRIVREFHAAGKPIGAICIAPVIIARVLGKLGITVTIGNDTAMAAEILKTGAHHETCAVTDYVTDRDHKVITTPAYMYDTEPHLVFQGVHGLIRELVEMA